jgi:type I restriction enzyme S subunit
VTAATGDFPRDWPLQRLGDIFAFSNGVNADKSSYGKGCRFINVLETITYSHIRGPEVPGRVTLPSAVVDAYSVEKGDILFNRTSETDADVGLASAYVGEERVVFGGFVIRGRPLKDAFDSTYAGYALRAPFIRSQVISMGQGAVRSNIGQQSLKRVVVPVPPAKEQRAIAEALSNVDALLAGLDRLIAKKRDLKQAAMQQLLTGNVRLPRFTGTWATTSLSELAEIVSGGTPATSEPTYWNGDIKWCTPTDITASPGKYLSDTARSISALGLRSSGARLLPAGALLLCSRATIGELKIAAYEVCTNQGFKSLVCRPHVSNEFLYYKLLTMKAQMVERAFGSTFLEISTANVAALAIAVPSLQEQSAIAEVLSDMDGELVALEARRAKTRALKQAMMQELLTGRIRLI